MELTRTTIEAQLEKDEEVGYYSDFSLKTIRLKDDEGKEIDYTGMDIHHTNCIFTKWIGPNLTRLQAPHTNFTSALFSHVTLDQANLQQATMDSVSINDASMQDLYALRTQFDGALFERNQMQGANLGSATIRKAQFMRCVLSESVLAGAQGREASFSACDLQRVDFQHANLTNAVFLLCDFTGANFSHANLTNAVFTDCTLSQVDLAYADLTGVCITLEQLRSANLLHIWQAFEKICEIRSRGAVIAYRDECLKQGEATSLSAYLGMYGVPNGPAHCIEQFSYGLIPKKNEDGDIDTRYSDEPVRTILLEWIHAWLNQ